MTLLDKAIQDMESALNAMPIGRCFICAHENDGKCKHGGNCFEWRGKKKLGRGQKQMDIRYAVKRNGLWLQGIEPRGKTQTFVTSPTMGTRYTHSDYETTWGREPKYFERLTFAGYIKTLTEEYRWGDMEQSDFMVVCKKTWGPK